MLSIYFVCIHHYLDIDIKYRKLPNKPSYRIQQPSEEKKTTERKKERKTSHSEHRVSQRFVLFANICVQWAQRTSVKELRKVKSIGLDASSRTNIYPLFDQMFVMLCNVPIYLHLFRIARTLSFLFVNIFWLIQQTIYTKHFATSSFFLLVFFFASKNSMDPIAKMPFSKTFEVTGILDRADQNSRWICPNDSWALIHCPNSYSGINCVSKILEQRILCSAVAKIQHYTYFPKNFMG